MAKKGVYRKLPEPDFLPMARNPRGRPVKDESHFQGEKFLRQVYFLTLLGATDTQLAQAFGVSIKSIEAWKRTKPEFLEALQNGKLQADANVAQSLYHAALGYTVDETVVLSNKVQKFDKNGKVVEQWTEPLLVPVKKNYPPNVTACLKWLTARQPGIWAERFQVSGKLAVTHSIDLSDFSTEELSVLNRLSMKQHNGGKDVIDIPLED